MEDTSSPKFEWQDLSDEWQKKLLSNDFKIKNCLGDGNCQFRAIETAVSNPKVTHDKLRKMIGQYLENLQSEDFWNIVKSYKLEKKNGEFIGSWDPYNIRYKRQFISIVKKPGNVFQGDDFTLSVLSKLLDTDFILFTEDCRIQDLSNPDDLHANIICLYFANNHYQTIGLCEAEQSPEQKEAKKSKQKEANIKCMFARSELHPSLDMLLDKQSFLMNHIKNVCESKSCQHLQLNDIIRSLEQNIQQNLSSGDKKKAMHLIKLWLQNVKFFENENETTFK